MEVKGNLKENLSNYRNYLYRQYNFFEGLGTKFYISEITSITHSGIIGIYNILLFLSIVKDFWNIKMQLDIYEDNLINGKNKSDSKYFKLKEMYDQYVDIISNHIKEKNLTDPVDIGIYFMLLLDSGDLSYTNEFNFKITKGDRDWESIKTMGARIVSGYGVCRNMAALMNDIYNKLGYESVILGVNVYNNYSVIPRVKNILSYPNHVVVLVNSDKGNIILDPTSKFISQIKDNFKYTKDTHLYTGKKVGYTYCLIDYYDDIYLEKIDDNFNFKKYKNREINEEDLNTRFKNICISNAKKQKVNKSRVFDDKDYVFLRKMSKLEYSVNIETPKKKKIKTKKF